ncbi:KCNJ11 [Symbiodinium pilosum]|uniref:KCNJ11 protein n=1 Tax=Symbiodinium pilosum TaxID=2952 RepID=A0A812XA07_SYMPI|nr:KCNJ11 [Symbiodinium pilosum]
MTGMAHADATEHADPEVFNIENALEAFLADVDCKELKFPPLDPDQRKQAKKLAEKYPEIKCESYGFGEERRLHLFKTSASLKASLVKEGGKEVHGAECASDQSTVVSGAASPESKEDASPTALFEEVAALLSSLYQVRNTFIHIEEKGVVDQRNIQSMPHGMFRQHLQEEAAQSAQDYVEGPATPTTATATPTEPQTPTLPVAEVPEAIEELAPGTEVLIEGLQKFPAFNGLRGTIQLLDKATGRYNVQLASGDGPLEQIAKIKGENLRVLVPPPPPFASEQPSKMHARAPDFVPMHCMRMPNMQLNAQPSVQPTMQPNPTWQEPALTIQQSYDPSQYYAYQYAPKIAAR